jgi:hypothetical protein
MGSLAVEAGGFCVPTCKTYLSAPDDADQLNVGVELTVLLFPGDVRLNEPGGVQVVAAVVNVAQALVVNGQLAAFVFLATTRHSYVVFGDRAGGLKLVPAVVNTGELDVQAPDPETPM